MRDSQPGGHAGLRLRGFALSACIVAAAFSRHVPHPPNFTPIGAIALFGGASFASPWTAVFFPLAAMFVSDLALEISTGTGFHALLPVVYGCFVLTGWLGLRLRGQVHLTTVAGTSLLAASLFFLVTNLAWWAQGGIYPMTPAGVLDCYVAAIPFFGNTLAGDLGYAAVLFGGFRLLERKFAVLRSPTTVLR